MSISTLQFLGTESYPHETDTVHLLLESNDNKMLIDCGSTITKTLYKLGLSPTEISDLFITHTHIDHFIGVPYYLIGHFFVRVGSIITVSHKVKPLSIHCSIEVFDAIKNIMKIVSPGFDIIMKDANYKYEQTTSGSTFMVGSVEATIIEVEHSVPTQGLILKGEGRKVFYSADTVYSEKLIQLVGKCDVVIHEAMYLEKDRMIANQLKHATAQDAGRFASKVCAQELYIVHISDTYHDKELVISEARNEFKGKVIIPNRYDKLKF